MSKAAAMHPDGNERMSAAASSKVPHSVGNSSESMYALTDNSVGSSRGKDMSWIMRSESSMWFGYQTQGRSAEKNQCGLPALAL